MWETGSGDTLHFVIYHLHATETISMEIGYHGTWDPFENICVSFESKSCNRWSYKTVYQQSKVDRVLHVRFQLSFVYNRHRVLDSYVNLFKLERLRQLHFKNALPFNDAYFPINDYKIALSYKPINNDDIARGQNSTLYQFFLVYDYKNIVVAAATAYIEYLNLFVSYHFSECYNSSIWLFELWTCINSVQLAGKNWLKWQKID